MFGGWSIVGKKVDCLAVIVKMEERDALGSQLLFPDTFAEIYIKRQSVSWK